jgi:hypothetical protein
LSASANCFSRNRNTWAFETVSVAAIDLT